MTLTVAMEPAWKRHRIIPPSRLEIVLLSTVNGLRKRNKIVGNKDGTMTVWNGIRSGMRKRIKPPTIQIGQAKSSFGTSKGLMKLLNEKMFEELM